MSATSTVARWMSRLFHPFIVAAVAMFLILWLSQLTLQESVKWTSLSIAIVIIPATLFILVQLRRGGYDDFDVSIREQRYALFGVGAASLIALIIVATVTNAPRIFFACLYAAVLATIVGAVVNKLLTKISIHSAALAGVASVMGFIHLPSAIMSWLLWATVGWARVHLGKHTVSQVLLGGIVATGCVWLIFGIYL